jgi:hypothetical protein
LGTFSSQVVEAGKAILNNRGKMANGNGTERVSEIEAVTTDE